MRIALYALLTVAACIVASLAIKYGSFVFHSRECSDVYLRYRDRDGIEADFVSQLHVGDSVRVDVTVLHATTDSAWWALWHEFKMPEVPPYIVDILSSDTNHLLVGQRKADALDQEIDHIGDTPAVVVTFSFFEHTVSIFHTKNYDEIVAVRHNRYFNEKIY